MFERVLIANRGEIAVRIARTLRRLGIESVAICSDADTDAPHALAADLAVRIGPASAAESYLDAERILAAAERTRADAVHPGYGFLSERPDFARACRDAGLVFIGPSPEAIALLGDKAAAKDAASAAGVPVVPGLSGQQLSDEEIAAWAHGQPLPLLLKAAGGGGGKGMRVVHSLAELPGAIAAARREARSAFGDDRLIVERYVEHARHIEVQVIADSHGNVVHLGERECSLQRRHQKVIEEAPSPVVDAPLRERLGGAAVALAGACGYENAGTVELVADRDDPHSFFFLEMNARLQVEHPVTEAVTGLDLVELQLRVAAGEPLPLRQDDVKLDGHAIEARLYAEDPANDFLPSTGVVALYREPGGIRFDSGIAAGVQIGTDYDPMLGKAIAHAPDRAAAIRKLKAGLAQTRILGQAPPHGGAGLTTNLAWLLTLLDRPEVRSGALDTTLLERISAELAADAAQERLTAGLAAAALLARERGEDPWDARDGWSVRGAEEVSIQLCGPDGEHEARLVPDRGHALVSHRGYEDDRAALADTAWLIDGARVRARERDLLVEEPDGTLRRIGLAHDGAAVWLFEGGAAARFAPPAPLAGARSGHDSLQAPMPGVVLEVRAQVGRAVGKGEVLVVLESMKMELSLASPEDGVVETIHVAAGDRVAQGQPLLELEER